MIRAATRDDIPGLARVHVQSWLETYGGLVPQEILDSITLESRVLQWERTFDQPYGIFVALGDEGLIGFASCGVSRDVRFEAELFTVYLLKTHQGRGIGRELWAAALDFMQARGWKTFVLWVLESNPTRDFYEHLGGVLVDRKVEVMHGTELLEVAYSFNLKTRG